MILQSTEDPEALARTLAGFVPAVVEGAVSDALIVQAAERAEIAEVASAAGAALLTGARPAEIIAATRAPWILLLEAGSRLEPGWVDSVRHWLEDGRGPGCFRLEGGVFRRVVPGRRGLAQGLLIERAAAIASARQAEDLGRLARKVRARRLPVRISRYPARVRT
ncbi:hypothetical protein SAMN05216548_101230 [Faunimonas pinastri]|uniref:Glycosyl transferase family 2 n=1 Tax=Faunimonas pinastri TaxID=1855383 RepID=A0A1H8ZSZ3_9HYPH|nr:hypothetical protein [Faunimonas pinastri]SEP67387.1 hypothetical protein SAMN05216548_101230 [Faunimonas pinastri]